MEYSSQVAAEVDALVVLVHERAALHPEREGLLDRYGGHPALLDAVSCVLVRRPLTEEELCVIVPYTPAEWINALLANNVAAGLAVTRPGSPLSLTDTGGAFARGIAALQEDVADTSWAQHGPAMRSVCTLGAAVIDQAQHLPPPAAPSAFRLFVPVEPAEPDATQTLRVLRALRYWRADCHRGAWLERGLTAAEAHALNHLWDADRGTVRPGQGSAELAHAGVSALEGKGLATSGRITTDGLVLRERIEAATDQRAGEPFAALDTAARAELLGALRSLPR
jgi:hypothetical protein